MHHVVETKVKKLVDAEGMSRSADTQEGPACTSPACVLAMAVCVGGLQPQLTVACHLISVATSEAKSGWSGSLGNLWQSQSDWQSWEFKA